MRWPHAPNESALSMPISEYRSARTMTLVCGLLRRMRAIRAPLSEGAMCRRMMRGLSVVQA